MEQLQTKRIRFSKEADSWLRVMKSRTEITPNLLCRLGFCLSLEEGGIPENEKYDEGSDREINRYTLLGDLELVLTSLLRQRLQADGIPLTEMDRQFRAHLHRGVVLLAGRLKALTDLAAVLTC